MKMTTKTKEQNNLKSFHQCFCKVQRNFYSLLKVVRMVPWQDCVIAQQIQLTNRITIISENILLLQSRHWPPFTRPLVAFSCKSVQLTLSQNVLLPYFKTPGLVKLCFLNDKKLYGIGPRSASTAKKEESPSSLGSLPNLFSHE